MKMHSMLLGVTIALMALTSTAFAVGIGPPALGVSLIQHYMGLEVSTGTDSLFVLPTHDSSIIDVSWLNMPDGGDPPDDPEPNPDPSPGPGDDGSGSSDAILLHLKAVPGIFRL